MKPKSLVNSNSQGSSTDESDESKEFLSEAEVNSQADHVYQMLLDQEGFSEEQALAIAMTRVGKEGAQLQDDEGFDEDELSVRNPESEPLLGENEKV